jgi:hypothetical protein
MSALFERGYAMGRRGYPWSKNLPGLEASRPQSGPRLRSAMN